MPSSSNSHDKNDTHNKNNHNKNSDHQHNLPMQSDGETSHEHQNQSNHDDSYQRLNQASFETWAQVTNQVINPATNQHNQTSHHQNNQPSSNVPSNNALPSNVPPSLLRTDPTYSADTQTFFYGEAEYSEEDTYATMTIYDPDADRFEDIEDNIIEDEIINCYAYSRKTGKPVKQLAIDGVSKVLSNDKHFVWLGLYEPSIETLTQVQQAFDLHELALEDAVADHQRAKIESYDNDTIFVVVQTAKLDNNIIQYGKTAIFMGKNFIITIRTGPSNSYTPVREHYKQRPDKLKLGPIFVLHAILDFIVDNYLPIVDRLGSYLREQEQSIFSYEFSRSTLKRLYELKSQLIRMRAVMLPVQDICNFFINHKKNELISFFPTSAKPYFRDVRDHLLQALDAVNGLNEMLSVAMDTYIAVVNMGQNDVVRKLAAWAGILAVPTAIAGIYGMNFDTMPELHFKYGYLLVWLLIIVICTSLYRLFKKTGWL